MAELTEKQKLEADLAEAKKRYEDAKATAGPSERVALIADITESKKALEREREREFLRQQNLVPPGTTRQCDCYINVEYV